MDTNKILKQPLALANLYANGKGTLWNTNPEAADFLSKTGSTVSLEQLKRATVVLNYPEVISNLFSHTGINTRTRRRLGTARKRFGVEALVEKAMTLRPARTEAERSNILAILNNEPTQKGLWEGVLPAELVRIYEEGLSSRRWDNPSQARKGMGVGTQLYKAIKIMQLPDAILDLFSVESLTFDLGRKLVNLVAIHGVEEIVRRATWSADPELPISNKQKIAELSEPGSGAATEVRTRRARGKIIVEFHIPDVDGVLTRKLPDLTSILNMSVAMFASKK
ncbi:hypothetical protein [Caballeronia sp. DA-9]|uniref:hypothetical protein n=1 Tax=Caballeronia sp. DA-9 TaxID=3436237 RepID=UPI003F66F557